MKKYRLLLTADKRGSQTVLYKEFVGKKWFFKKPTVQSTEHKTKATTFIKEICLLDITTKTYRKQTVFLEVVGITDKFIQVEVK